MWAAARLPGRMEKFAFYPSVLFFLYWRFGSCRRSDWLGPGVKGFGFVTNGNREVYLAADLGASSGRLVAGGFDGSRIQLEDVHRFENGGVEVADHLYWDFLDLWMFGVCLVLLRERSGFSGFMDFRSGLFRVFVVRD